MISAPLDNLVVERGTKIIQHHVIYGPLEHLVAELLKYKILCHMYIDRKLDGRYRN